MEKEEEIIFPNLRAGGTAMVAYPIGIMRQEHTSHGDMLEHLMALTHDATPPEGACNTWRALYAGIAQLGDDLINHIHLENNVLFPQFEPKAMPQPAAVDRPADVAARAEPVQPTPEKRPPDQGGLFCVGSTGSGRQRQQALARLAVLALEVGHECRPC